MSIPLPKDLNQMAQRMSLYGLTYTDGIKNYWYDESTDTRMSSDIDGSNVSDSIEWADVDIENIREVK
jgi:hypothetical protein